MYECAQKQNKYHLSATKSPCSKPDRTSLDLAYYSILQLVRDDQYPKYMDYILVQRQLRVSRLEAQWWKNVRGGFVGQAWWLKRAWDRLSLVTGTLCGSCGS